MPIPPPEATPRAELDKRQSRVRAAMLADNLDLLICYGDAWRTANTRYFTDFRPVDGINGIEQALLFFPLDGQPQLFVAEGCLGAAQEHTPFRVRPLAELVNTVPTAMTGGSRNAVGVAGRNQMPAPLAAALGNRLGASGMADTDVLARTKAVKSEWEVSQLRHAAALTDVAMTRMEEVIGSGAACTERDLAREADAAMIQAGADGVAFLSMVQAGPRSAHSLALPSDRAIRSGDIVMTDIGARYGNYVADGGRGVTVGRVTDQTLALVDASVAAVEAGLSAARVGITASVLNQAIQEVLVDRGYAEYSVEARGRGTGHGTGMDPEEEYPWIGPTNEDLLLPGMVFTLKATINVPRLGGLRTERVVHLTDEGAEPLDEFPMHNRW